MCELLRGLDCVSLSVRCLSCAACCSLAVACCSLFVLRRVLRADYRLLLVSDVCHFVFVAWCCL